MSISAIPILPVQSASGNQWAATRIIEELTQTFQQGTPVAVTPADGGVAAWDGATLTGGQGSPIGISYEAASNISSTGKGAPTPFQPLTGIGTGVTFGSVPNQASAVNIPMGAPINDGRVGVIAGSLDNFFSAIFGNNGNTATPAATDVGKAYGLTIDSNSKFWYVDKNKTGASACVKVTALDPRDVVAAGSRVIFQFIPTVVNSAING